MTQGWLSFFRRLEVLINWQQGVRWKTCGRHGRLAKIATVAEDGLLESIPFYSELFAGKEVWSKESILKRLHAVTGSKNAHSEQV